MYVIRRLSFSAALIAVAAGLFSLTSPGCTRHNPRYCDNDRYPCQGAGEHCNLTLNACVASDAAVSDDAPAERAETGDAVDAIDASGCAFVGCPAATPVCMDGTTCVECTEASHCKAMTTKPLCIAHSCAPCRTDADCSDPGVCMPDGHCVAPDEAVVVEYNASGCVGGNGSSAAPFCNFAAAVPALEAKRPVLVLRGPADDRLTLAPAGFAVTVVGQKNASDDPSIAASASPAINVTAGRVSVRDLDCVSSSASQGRCISVSGSTTQVSLLRVKVRGNQGTGIEAKTGAELTMNRCIVQNAVAGGVLNNGSTTIIKNSVMIGNGSYGVRFATAAASSVFEFNTVISSSGSAAAICDINTPQTLTASIVVGSAPDCVMASSVTTAPAFDGTGYHLTAHRACPGAEPATYPADDIDGDSRTSPIDCGADQYKP